MRAFCAPRAPCGFRPEKRFSWRLVGLLLVAPVLLLSLNSDACGEPPIYDSMDLKGIPKTYYEVGEKIFYECHQGYTTNQAIISFCEKNHSWSPLEEACFRKACQEPVLKNGGVFSPNYTYQFGNEARFFCDEGYYLSGKQNILCVRHGDDVLWDDVFPICNKIQCKPPPKIKNGEYNNSHQDLFEYNQLIIFTCDPPNGPDEFSLIGESKLICIENNKWSSNPPQCKVIRCENPVLHNGRVISGMRDKYSYQAVVLFECLPGFYLNGSNPVMCGEKSTWEPAMPKCFTGVKPTHAAKPLVSKYPGYPESHESLSLQDFEELDAGIVAVIVLTILVGLAVLCTCLYRCFQREKKG